jgi:hypothetical protein
VKVYSYKDVIARGRESGFGNKFCPFFDVYRNLISFQETIHQQSTILRF